MKVIKKSFAIGFALALASCGGGGEVKEVVDNDKRPDDGMEKEAEIDVSRGFNTLILSLSNDKLTAHSVDKGAAEEIARSLETAAKSEPKRENYLALIAARRIAGMSYESVAQAASQLADIEMKKDIDRGVPIIAKLELAIAAVRAKKYSMAEHFLPSILNSKIADVKAAGYNLQGVIEYADGRVPEAINSWLIARKEKDKYQPATLNLALVSLRRGAYKFADAMLKDLDDDWLVQLGRATVERMSGNSKGSVDLCQKVLAEKKNKLTLVNCAVTAYQSEGNFEKAKQLMNEAAGMRGGSELDKRSGELSDRIAKEAAKEKKPAAKPEKEAEPKKAG